MAAANNTSGNVQLFINGRAALLQGDVPMRPNRFVKSTVIGSRGPIGADKIPQAVMIGPVTVRVDEVFTAAYFRDLAEATGPAGCVRVQVIDASDRSYSNNQAYITGDIDVSPEQRTVTFSLESELAIEESV